jgi:hypothetical protein
MGGALASFAPISPLEVVSVASFAAFLPTYPATCAAILAGLGSFVTLLATANCHFGGVGFVRATSTRSTRPDAGWSSRDNQCEQQRCCACDIS